MSKIDKGLRPRLPLDGADLERWLRFATRGGIGKASAARDKEALGEHELMFLSGDEVVLLLAWDEAGTFLSFCEGVVGLAHLEDLRLMTPIKKATLTRRKSSKDMRSATAESTSSRRSQSQQAVVPLPDTLQPPKQFATPPPDSPSSLLDLYNTNNNINSSLGRMSSKNSKGSQDGHWRDLDEGDETPKPRRVLFADTSLPHNDEQDHKPQMETTEVLHQSSLRQSRPPDSWSSPAQSEHLRSLSSSALSSGSLASSLRHKYDEGAQSLTYPSTSENVSPTSVSSMSLSQSTSLRARSPPTPTGFASHRQEHNGKLRLRSPSSPTSFNLASSTIIDSSQHRSSAAGSPHDTDPFSSTAHSARFSDAVAPAGVGKIDTLRRPSVASQSSTSPVVETKKGAFEMMTPQANDSVSQLDAHQRVSLWSDSTSIDIPLPNSRSRMSNKRMSAEAEAASLHREKERDWLDLFKKYANVRQASSSKLLKHCKRGIPSSVRFRAWVLLADGELGGNMFHALLEQSPVSPEEHRRIDTDLHHLFGHHPLFQTGGTAPRQDIASLLHALSQQKPGNYRPPLAFLVNGILQFSAPETAFGLFSAIVSNKFPLLYGAKSTPGTIVFILRELLRKQDAQILTRLQNEGGVGQLVELWLAPLFLNGVLPAETALRVLDVALLEGERFLFAISLSMLSQLRELLLDTSVNLRRILEAPPEDLVAPSMLLSDAFTIKIKSSAIDKLARQAFQHRV